MKTRYSVATAFVILILALAIFARDYSRTCSVTGGAPQQLSAILTANKYTGFDATMQLDVLTICNVKGNANDLYIGGPDVDATTGVDLEPSDCYTWPPGSRPTDAQSIYLFVSATESVGITLRSR